MKYDLSIIYTKIHSLLVEKEWNLNNLEAYDLCFSCIPFPIFKSEKNNSLREKC